MSNEILSLFPELEKDLLSLHTSGVLPSQKIKELITVGCVVASAPIEDGQVQPASIDLRLGPVAYRVRASFLPGGTSTVLRKVEELKLHELDLTQPAVLEKGCVYIVPLMEELYLPSQIFGKANPKSTIGRLDVFTRLITDYSTEFERVPEGYKGKLYLEIVPRTFSILVRQGTRMNQLRFIRGSPLSSDAQLSKLHKDEILVYLENETKEFPGDALIYNGLWVSIDLQQGDGSEIVGYKAKKHAPLINLNKIDYYDPSEFWEPIVRPKMKQIILNPEDFYILASREKIRVPHSFAAEMVAYDASVGEFRIHYAGFFDPGFGYGNADIKGARAVLEVRSHEVPFLLEDGQKAGRLIFERLLADPEKVYGPGSGASYQCQGLALSKQFKRC